jgi:hypothetical protein
MTLVYLQLQFHKFLELVMTCSTNSKKKSGAGAVPNIPLLYKRKQSFDDMAHVWPSPPPHMKPLSLVTLLIVNGQTPHPICDQQIPGAMTNLHYPISL